MKNFILRNKKSVSAKKGKSKNEDTKRRNSNSTYASTTSSSAATFSSKSKKSEKPCKIEKETLPRKKKTFMDQLLDIKDGKQKSYLDNLRQEPKSRDSCFSNDERVQELKDQNQYLVEKVQFLRLQKLRNESEIVRMDAKQIELRKIHDMYAKQLAHIESLIDEWQEFHTKLIRASEEWSEKSMKILQEEEMKYNENLAPVVVPELL